MALVFVEHDNGVPTDPSLEALTLARQIADDEGSHLAAGVFEPDAADTTDALATYGVTEVYGIAHDRLDGYAPAAWGQSLAQLAETTEPPAIVAPGTDRGHEILAHLGATLELPIAANCLAVTVGPTYEVTRQRWGGSLLEDARLDGDPKLLTVSPHEVKATPVDEPTSPALSEFSPTLDDAAFRVEVSRIEEADIEGVPLGEARVVVSGGRGVGSAEDFAQLEALADLLGGTVGASRAAVNAGWRPHDDQVGLTGAKISPEIYIACGISGAIQHMVGCKGAKHILAINIDPEAAIIQKADWAIIGDLHEVLPAITEAIRDAQ